MVQAAAGGVMRVFSLHILCLLVPIGHHLNTTVVSLSIFADHVHLFMTTVYPYCDGNFQQDNAAGHKSSQVTYVTLVPRGNETLRRDARGTPSALSSSESYV